MKSPRIFSPATVMGALSLFALPAAQGIAQTTATTDPVGYAQTACLASTDTKLSLPFSRPADFVGAISSVSGNTITVASTLPGGANAFVYGSAAEAAVGDASKTYYAIIGPKITALASPVGVTNNSTTVTGTGLGSIVAGDELLVNNLAFSVVSVAAGGTSLTLDRAYTGTTATGLSASYDHSPQEGSYYMVTANGSNTVTVTLGNDTLGSVAVGTTVSLIPYWTLVTAFPAADAGTSYIASTNTNNGGRQTQILIPDTTPGVNLASSVTYYYFNNWRKVGNAANQNDAILSPTSYFTLRNAATATTFTPAGGVYMNRYSIVLNSQTADSQDNPVSVPRPTAVALKDLGLISSGAFTPSTSGTNAGRQDQLFVYDNTVPGINKAATSTYYFFNTWRKVGGGTTDVGSTTIPYGVGFIIRKAITDGSPIAWQNTRNY